MRNRLLRLRVAFLLLFLAPVVALADPGDCEEAAGDSKCKLLRSTDMFDEFIMHLYQEMHRATSELAQLQEESAKRHEALQHYERRVNAVLDALTLRLDTLTRRVEEAEAKMMRTEDGLTSHSGQE